MAINNEDLKKGSRGLRGHIRETLQSEATHFEEEEFLLLKFHGSYQQDDRDLRRQRKAEGLDKAWQFMVRSKIPGGDLTAEQYLVHDRMADELANHTIRFTNRQGIQMHGILFGSLRDCIHRINACGLTTRGACGDVVRNTVASAIPFSDAPHREAQELSKLISRTFYPATRGYSEIWLDDEKITEDPEPDDPIYGDAYLPRKFKIGIAIPPNNDVDVLTNDLGLIAIIEDNELKGFNIAIGGGLGATHGNPDTYPRLATVIGFVPADERLFKAIYEVVTIQRDYGNRSDRKLARLKYTLDKYGAEWYRQELEKRTGFPLEEARPYTFSDRTELYGWQQDHKGLWHYTLFVENGRVVDEAVPLKTALLEVAGTRKANFRFTVNQKIIVADVKKKDKTAVNEILKKYGLIEHTEAASAIRRNSIACVALPTCGLALAESQRYLPALTTHIDRLLAGHDLQDEKIIVRMTGCPNGCGRPYAAEIGFVGTAPGRYNLYLCGDHEGTRLNRIYKENLDEAAILKELDLLFWLYKKERITGERFGDFALRQRWYKQ